MMRADLHLHTYYSDGLHSPSEVVDRAAAGGLDLIAITDHDSIGGWQEAVETGRKKGVSVLPAAEFTAHAEGGEIHLLGYFREAPGREVTDFLQKQQAFRRGRIEIAITRLRERGLPVDFDELPRASCCESLTSVHLARLLLEKGFGRTHRSVRRRFLGADVVPSFDKRPKEVIQVIHAGGGLAVWAHPPPGRFRRRLEALVAAGLDGIETKNFARRHGLSREWHHGANTWSLVMTGGSDWHGNGRLGEFYLNGEVLAPFLHRLGV